MDINRKLDIFYRAVMEAADAKSAELLEEQGKGFERELEEYEVSRKQEEQRRIRQAEEKLRREVNRTTAAQLLELKKEYHSSQEECREELFSIVQEKLAAYRATDAYARQLSEMARRAKDFAKGAELTIYLSPADAAHSAALAAETGCPVLVGDEDFIGGIRAVIPEKNVLLDESFSTKLAREREEWSGWK